MSAPSITGLSAISFTEGAAAVAIDQGVAFSGGSGFAGGSIRFNVAGSNASDQLLLGDAADPNASGAISVNAGVVYLGNGATRDPIGTVDAVENGQNGAALKINLGVSTGVVNNPSFETDLSGWTIGQSRVILGTTQINGWTTPTDPTVPASAGDDAGAINSMTYTAVRALDQHTAGDSSLRLYNSGQTAAGFDVVHGPYAVSNTFNAAAGDVFKFDWRAAAGSDAYDAFGYLMNAGTGASVVLLNETGASASGVKEWTAESVVIPTTGQWFFVFVAGTYDFTGGRGVGGSLYVDNLQTLASTVSDATLKAITSQITYQSTSDAPAAGGRNLTIAVEDSAGATSSASSTLTVAAVNDAPTGVAAIAGTATEGSTLTASNTVADPDGLGAITYQWQRSDGAGGWTDIGAATGSTYQLAAADIGHTVRVRAGYTDAGGTAETVNSAATGVVANLNDVPAGPVAVTGAATQGQVLTASNTVTDADGLSGPITYQWQREASPGVWTDIAGATHTTFTLTQAEVGHAVRAVARYTDDRGTAESVPSAGTATVANVNDAPTGAVAIGGGTVVGETLTASHTIVDADGFNPASLSYQWQRANGAGGWTDIGGATGASYRLVDADYGFAVRLVARYTDNAGAQESVASAPTATVGVPAPEALPTPAFNEVENQAVGTVGDDVMAGLGGGDQLDGGGGQDFLQGNQGDDFIYGNQGQDTLHGGQQSDVVRGGRDDDLTFGDAGDDLVYGDLGADRVDGGDGDDVLWGGQGAQSSPSDLGDSLFGGMGNDYANGNAGQDTLDGGQGRDTLQGGRGDDVIAGGEQDDVLMGDFGDDTLTGGSGADIFNFGGGGIDRVTDFSAVDGDRIVLEAGTAYRVAQAGADTVVSWTGGEVVLANVQVSTLSGGWIVA
jgi:Ca2+-binding RTX toxin-like protein